MNPSEARAWSLGVSPDLVQAVRDAAAHARGDWCIRIGQPAELKAIACWALGGWFDPGGVINAAAEITIELAIVVACFPEEPRRVLRPSWE